MSAKFLSAVSVVGLSLLLAPATAQYVGASAVPPYTSVAEVLKNPVDDAEVSFEGYLIKRIAPKKYIFSDGVAEIRVEIDQKKFPATPINEKTKVHIRGEVEKGFMESPEVDVDVLSVVLELAK